LDKTHTKVDIFKEIHFGGVAVSDGEVRRHELSEHIHEFVAIQ